jgi:hypothetical protein
MAKGTARTIQPNQKGNVKTSSTQPNYKGKKHQYRRPEAWFNMSSEQVSSKDPFDESGNQ